MAEAPNPAAPQLTAVSVPPDDPIFDFTCTDWLDPPSFVTTLPETTKESNIRSMTEKEYRDSTTSTAWHRYLTLGRYVTDGFTFDSIMADTLLDPRKVHCLIWFQYSYHLDHKIAIPSKLQAWYSRRSQPFLFSNHLNSAFNLDTKTTTWMSFSRSQSLSEPWSEVVSKQNKQKQKKRTSVQSFPNTATSILRQNGSKPSTISEETSRTSDLTDHRGKKRMSSNDDKTTTSDGKQSVLEHSLNVPVCDGTHRVTLRWKTTIDLTQISSQTQFLKDEIYKLLNDLFDDSDGLLYKWQQDGTEHNNSISKMPPNEVRQYLSPSISILPSSSTLVIPLRFGFSNNTPAKWRNLSSTKSKLEKHDVTISFSNCTSSSGDLTVAGYILLKAPMTTHRLRYLQSLRKLLPPTTSAFDILLHKRTPLDQQIPHLVVQCGNKTVHPLSEALATILTGDSSALYIPRFALSHMTEDESKTLFATHDNHVKSLRWLKLNPLLSNLDKPRKEYNSNGTITERTTREWARQIKTIDGTAPAQCDVVNGGTDQLSYLLFSPQHTEAATKALEDYRQLLYPFTQREAKFRESVGPPPFIHMSRHVIANLDFIKRLSSNSSQLGDLSTNASPSNDSTSSAATPDSDMTELSPPQVVRPPTSQESLQKLYRQHTLNSSSSADESRTVDDDDDESTSATTVTGTSNLSAGRMSTSSAKFRELDAVLQRQSKTNAQKEAKSSERISSIERQLHRINDLDSKLDKVQADFGCRLNLFEARMVESVTATMNSNMQQLIGLVNKLAASELNNHSDTTLSITEIPATVDPSTVLRDQLLYTNGSSSSSTSNSESLSSSSNLQHSKSSSDSSSMSVESTARIQSPEHKRLRSGKKQLKASIRRHLDSALEAVCDSQPSSLAPPSTVDSLDKVMTEVEEIMKTDFSSIEHTIVNPDTTDLANQYTAGSTQDTSNTAFLSPGQSSLT